MTNLNVRRTAFAGEASPHAGEGIELYEVIGLPLGHEVFLRRTDGKWKVLRVKNGVRQSWSEGYESLDDAFETVRGEYEGERQR
jgi:hypothetical protein